MAHGAVLIASGRRARALCGLALLASGCALEVPALVPRGDASTPPPDVARDAADAAPQADVTPPPADVTPRCAEGLTACGAHCVDTRSDPRHCGACARPCDGARGRSGLCVEGRCACARGFDDCDRDPANGCEAALDTDARHCGACGRSCVAPRLTATCGAGVCAAPQCEAWWADCDGDRANGCEEHTLSARHCGRCGNACPAFANAESVCVPPGGQCAPVCRAGFGNCDGNNGNGCEADLSTSPRHCGRCNVPCNGTCVGGVCTPL